MKKLVFLLLTFLLFGCSDLNKQLGNYLSKATKENISKEIDKNYTHNSEILEFKLKNIKFSKFKSNVSPAYEKEIKKYFKEINRVPYYRICLCNSYVLLTGYTDIDEEKQGYNNLANERIEAIKNILIQMKIEPNRILIKDLGGIKYPHKNDTNINKAKNRIVEIDIVKRRY